ncbi:MAG: tetratricopeptide repeat protein [Bacteroidales bacterium]|nr:tetratricopeptide repeat protein [Bacteroidales bacterium]
MKKLSTLFAAVALVLVATFSASAADNSYKVGNDKVTVTISDLAPNAAGTALQACYNIDVAPDAFDECASLLITPLVRDDNGHKKVIEIIVLNGESRKVNAEWLQRVCYGVCDPNHVRFFTVREGETTHVKTCTEVPYEDWMDEGAAFYVTTQKATYKPNCIKNYPGEEYICDIPYLTEPLVVDPVLAPIPVEAKLEGTRVLRTKLYYPVNVTRKVDNYLENAEALELLNTLDRGNFEVTDIAIEGWASPEATVRYNENLSINRAKTVKSIISDKYNFPQDVYTVKGNGEYWDSIIDYVDNTEEPIVATNREAIKDAIAANGDLDKREAAIKKIDGGKPYKAIFDAVYPRSRFAEAVVTFRNKGYNRQDCMTLYKADPKNLSADEYVLMIQDGASQDVVDNAVKLYPNDPRVAAVAAAKEYEAGNIDKAIELYKKAGNTEEVYNNLAACYLAKGDAENARACLEKVSDKKLSETNANELRKVVLNNKYFKK